MQRTASYNANNDAEIASPPDDSVSSIAFSPTHDLLLASSWDNKVRLWEFQRNGASAPKHMVQHQAPVLCTAWSPDGARFFSGSADKQVKMTDAATGTSNVVAQHDGVVSAIKVFNSPQMGTMLLTGSWDKTLKYWDLRTSSPVLTVPLADRLYCMDVNYPVLVVGTAEKGVTVYDMERPSQVFRKIDVPLKFPPRYVSVFNNRGGLAAGSIEGRVAIQNFEEPKEEARKSYSFKCHREPERSNECYSVNAVVFHPSQAYQTAFATVGSDGWYCFWDKDGKTRLYRPNSKLDVPITTCAFSNDGSIFAYSPGYDWSKGHAHNNQNIKSTILLKAVTPDLLRRKAK